MTYTDFPTLSQTMAQLKKEGYTTDFNLGTQCLSCNEKQLQLYPDDFQIDAVYRFEGASNPDDNAILYAISSEKFSVKGLLVNGYGISADMMTDEMIKKLATHPQNKN